VSRSSPIPKILLVAATELELCGHTGLVCGVGPVEAAVTTASQLALKPPKAVLHVGVAGGRRLTPGAVVIGTEAIYSDLETEHPVIDRAEPDPTLLAAMQAAFPEAISLPIATSAAVSGPTTTTPHELRVEGMEGFAVLRACELVGVPGIEVRVVSNDIGEGNRALWMMRRGVEVLAETVPRALAALDALE
jgi:predicted 5'-methylthioadenosine/S-adenosylhomocysteine nucleosidase